MYTLTLQVAIQKWFTMLYPLYLYQRLQPVFSWYFQGGSAAKLGGAPASQSSKRAPGRSITSSSAGKETIRWRFFFHIFFALCLGRCLIFLENRPEWNLYLFFPFEGLLTNASVWSLESIETFLSNLGRNYLGMITLNLGVNVLLLGSVSDWC